MLLSPSMQYLRTSFLLIFVRLSSSRRRSGNRQALTPAPPLLVVPLPGFQLPGVAIAPEAALPPPPLRGSPPQGASGSLEDPGIDPAIAAWWAGQHHAAAAAAGTPAVSPIYDVTVSPREPLQAAIDRSREGGSILLLPGA